MSRRKSGRREEEEEEEKEDATKTTNKNNMAMKNGFPRTGLTTRGLQKEKRKGR